MPLSSRAARRATYESECLRVLQDGPRSRNDLAAELESAGHPISESTVHAYMLDLEQRGVVRIYKANVRGRFSKFRWTYTLVTAQAVAHVRTATDTPSPAALDERSS